MFPACGEGKLEDSPPEPEGLMLVVGAPTRCPHQVSRPGVPTRCPDQVPGKFFCTIGFLFENASLVDFQIRKRGHGGDLEENGCFP